MLKIQYIILVLASLLVAGLYLLPKVVVENERSTEVASDAVTAQGDAMHEREISKERQNELNSLAEAFQKAGEENKASILEDLVAAYKSINRYDSAAYFLGEYANANPTFDNLVKAGDAYYEAYTLALENEKIKRLAEKVREFYMPALEISPDDLDLKTKVGMSYVSSENPMQGILMIREVLNQDPDNRLALLNMGMLAMQSGQFGKAVERFEKLVAVEPEDMQSRFYLGVSYMETGKREEALKQLKLVEQQTDEPQLKANVKSYIEQLEQ